MSRRAHNNPDAFGGDDEYAREQQAAYDDEWGAPLVPWWEER